MPLIGADTLVLPASAGIARAFAEVVPVPNPPPAGSALYTTSGSWYEVIVSVQASFITSANAGVRTVDILYRDAGGNVFEFIPPSGTQGPTLQNNYQWLLGFGNSVGPDNGNKIGPLPPVLMLPGYSLQVLLNPSIAGDQLVSIFLYVQRYPTGPRADLAPELALAPTPRLV